MTIADDFIIDQDVSPDGEPIELTFEDGHYTVSIAGEPLMSSSMHGSEQTMARRAAKRVGHRENAQVLIGGLGMGYTLRAALDTFSDDASITVAELLPAVIRYNRGVLEPLANYPLRDPRVTLFEGDLRDAVVGGPWDAILMDIDNGPKAFTVSSNADFYVAQGLHLIHRNLSPGGVLVIWSASSDKGFVRRVQDEGLQIEVMRVKTGGIEKKVKHTLFVLTAPTGGNCRTRANPNRR